MGVRQAPSNCFITDQPTTHIPSSVDCYEYSIQYNEREIVLRFQRENWQQIITDEIKTILQGMLYNDEWPIEKETIITKGLIDQLMRFGEFPRNFDEKLNYYLLKAYLAGGAEYKIIKYDLSKPQTAYAKDKDEFFRIVRGIYSKEVIKDRGDFTFTLTEKGVNLGKHLYEEKLGAEPKEFDNKNAPTVFFVSTEQDKFYAEQLKELLMKYGITIGSQGYLKDGFGGTSAVINSRDQLYESKTSYIVFVKSYFSDHSNSFGSILEIAFEAHARTDKRLHDYLYFAFVDDTELTSRPRMEHYNSKSLDFRITTNRKRLINMIAEDWRKRKSTATTVSTKYNLPRISLTENESFWLKICYEKFLKNEGFQWHEELAKHWDNLPKDFEPNRIDNRLLIGGVRITLLGLWHANPTSILIEKFDKTIFIVRELLKGKTENHVITSKAIQAKDPELTDDDIAKIIQLIAQFGGFFNTYGQNSETGEPTMTIRDASNYNHFRKYSGIEDLVNDFFNKRGSEDRSEGRSIPPPVYRLINSADSLNLSEKAFQSKSQVFLRDREQIDVVLGVKEIAKEIAEIIQIMPSEKGRMIGIFGKWGRGKTMFLTQLWENLKQFKNNGETQYERVDFHAWQYQETPASWAYLYEKLAEKYYMKPQKIFSLERWRYWKRIKRLNIERHGHWPLIKSLIIIAFACSIAYGGTVEWGKVFAQIGIPFIGAGLIAILSKFNKDYSTKAFDLIKKYGLKHTYKDTMGIQAEIQKEVVHLVKTWIPIEKESKESPNKNHKKIILFVEDVDRCAEDKIIQNIDALRIMLEDEEVAKRIIVIAAIDEQVLKRAIKSKYFKLLDCEDYSVESNSNKFDELAILTNEYLDKLFIAGIKLGTLSAAQRDEFIIELTKNDKENNVVETPSKETDSYKEPEINVQSDINIKGGDFSFKDGDSAFDKGKESTKTDDEIRYEKEIKPKSSNEAPAFEKLTSEEIKILRGSINNWDNATPRKIKIFYYRYLIAKNLLLNRYERLNQENIWKHPTYSTVFAQLIIRYSELHNPTLINEYKLKAELASPEEVVRIDMFEDVTLKNQDYVELLQVLEMVIAY